MHIYNEQYKQDHCTLFAQDVVQLERSGQHLNYVKSCKICILLRTKYAFKRFKHYRNMKTCIFLQIRFRFEPLKHNIMNLKTCIFQRNKVSNII